jgi:hypothetical protein
MYPVIFSEHCPLDEMKSDENQNNICFKDGFFVFSTLTLTTLNILNGLAFIN